MFHSHLLAILRNKILSPSVGNCENYNFSGIYPRFLEEHLHGGDSLTDTISIICSKIKYFRKKIATKLV
jgi:hypothetical protein